jgi:hypothetical protein
MNPPTLVEAEARGLLVEKGIHTFSNGTERCGWQECNCFDCWFWPYEGPAGEYCAFEAGIDLGEISPALARMFGWVESEKYPGSFEAPRECPFFKQRPEPGDNGEEILPPPPPDPNQLVLIADPNEDASVFANAPDILEEMALAGSTRGDPG